MENVVRHVTLLVVALAMVVAASACSSEDGGRPSAATTTTAGSATSASTAAATTTTDATAAFDRAALDHIATVAERGKSNCLLVSRNGELVDEWYFNGTDATSAQNVFSITKSVTSILVGIAQADGDLRITDRASRWITEWHGTPAESVTIRDLLSNDSGREWSLATDYGAFLQADDRTAFAIGLSQQHPPGTVWAYNNAAIQTLERVLHEATGHDVAQFARTRLFEPLGMTHTTMGRDRAGNPQTFEGVRSTCRDLARFGLLLLRHGKVDGTQIVPASRVEQATGRSSTKLNAAYGYLFWVNRKGRLASPTAAVDISGANGTVTTGRLVPGAPADMFWALGLGNQLVQVDPGSGTVVVRLGKPEARPQPPTFGPHEASAVVTDALGGG